MKKIKAPSFLFSLFDTPTTTQSKKREMTTTTETPSQWDSIPAMDAETGNDDVVMKKARKKKAPRRKRPRQRDAEYTLEEIEGTKKPRKKDDVPSGSTADKPKTKRKPKPAIGKKCRKNQSDQRVAIERLIVKVCGDGVRYNKKEVHNMLNDMTDQVFDELIGRSNVFKVSNNHITFSARHVSCAIRSCKLPLGMKSVMLEKAKDAIIRYNSVDKTDEEMNGKSIEFKAGLTLKVKRVQNKIRTLAQRGKAKDKKTGKAVKGSRVGVGAAIAIVAATEVVLHRIIGLGNNYAVSVRTQGDPTARITKEDIFQGVSLDVSTNPESGPNHPQEEDGLAHYFERTVFSYCGTTAAIPDNLVGVQLPISTGKK